MHAKRFFSSRSPMWLGEDDAPVLGRHELARASTPSTNGGRSLVQRRPTSSSSLLTSMNSPFDFYPDQHSSLSRSRPDTAPLT
jgi:hypothetical protein